MLPVPENVSAVVLVPSFNVPTVPMVPGEKLPDVVMPPIAVTVPLAWKLPVVLNALPAVVPLTVPVLVKLPVESAKPLRFSVPAEATVTADVAPVVIALPRFSVWLETTRLPIARFERIVPTPVAVGAEGERRRRVDCRRVAAGRAQC